MKSTQCHSSYDIFCQTQFQKCQSKLCTQITSSQIRNQLSNLQQLTLEVTDSCNLNCRYCGYGSYYSGYEERRNTFLSTRTVKKLLDYLTECWSSSANNSTRRTTTISFYGGEPLLNFKTIREVVDYSSSIQSNQVSFKYSMTTNAILLEKYMDYLVEKDFSLLISLDGNEYNHSYRVTKRDTNSFTKVLKNVKLLRSKYPVFYDKKVNFNAVLTNRSSVNEVYTFFKEELDKRPMLSELNTTGIVPEMKAEFIRTYRNLTESLHQAENYDIILKDLFTHTPDLKSLALFIHHYSGNVFQRYGDLLNSQRSTITLPTGTCFPFSRKMFVTVNGKILPCERVDHKHFLGEVTEEGVKIDFTAIAKKYNDYYNNFAPMCDNCYNSQACIQCIFQLDDLEADNPLCHGYMDHERFSNQVLRFIKMLEKNPEYYNKIIEETTFY